MSSIRTLLALPLLALMALLALTASPVMADDRVDHYKGKSAETLAQAVANFTEGNRELRELLAGEVSNPDLARIHELSYTLENALGKINGDLEELAELLEEVHVASETVDTETVTSSGNAYFEIVDALQLGESTAK